MGKGKNYIRPGFGVALMKAYQAAGFTRKAFSDKIGVSTNAVIKWEGEESFPSPKKWATIKDTVGLSPQSYRKYENEALTIHDESNPTNQHIDNESNVVSIFENISPRAVPVISWSVAGDFASISDTFQPGDADEWVFYLGKTPPGPNIFALKVFGDSMEPEFCEGDIVIVDPAREYKSGDYIIAKIPHQRSVGENGDSTLKKMVFDGPSTYLVPLNPKYSTIDMTDREFVIVGVVVQKVKDY